MRLFEVSPFVLAGSRLFAVLSLLFLFGGCAQAAEEAAPEGGVNAELAVTALFDLPAEEWWEPEPVVAKNGVLKTTLEVTYADHLVRDHEGKPRVLSLRSYDGQMVGPPLVARAGDTLFVRVENNLPKEGGSAAQHAAAHHAAMAPCPNVPHEFNTTNLHTHGLHISPKSPADDVFVSIEPGGGTHDYVFPVLPAGNPEPEKPATHYPGTFWYHAHRHGSTAIQLASGMAGPLLVLGDLDDMEEIRTAGQRLFVFQQIAYGGDGRVENFGDLRTNWRDVVKEHTRINGRLKPGFVMRPGQIERWRMIDAGIFGDVPFEIVPERSGARPFRSFQIAADGITFPHPRPVSKVEMAPGYRVDLLVQAPTVEGKYFLRKAASKFDFTALGPDGGQAPDPAGPQILAEILVRGERCKPGEKDCGTRIPRELPEPKEMLPPITDDEIVGDPKEVVFSVDGRTTPPSFLIENKCYHPDTILPKFELKEGTAEEWILKNTSTGPHPFHIHVNAFQVIESGKPTVWRDTVIIPPNGGEVRIRTRFERFDGEFVTHCHILTHEDLGMMQKIRISKSDSAAAGDGSGGE